jgi:hypothetical protein
VPPATAMAVLVTAAYCDAAAMGVIGIERLDGEHEFGPQSLTG